MSKLPFATWKVGDEEYKLKLTAGATISAEQKLGKSLIGSMSEVDAVRVQIIFLHASMQKFNANTSMDKVLDLYDDFLDNGGTIEDVADLIVEVLVVSGFMKKEQLEKAKEIATQA